MAQKKYTVETIVERTELRPDGRFYEVYEITYITAAGVRGSVKVPAEEYTKEEAKRRIDEIATIHEEVMGL